MSFTDKELIEAISANGGRSPTYAIKNRLIEKSPNVKTPEVLRRLRRLEREGLVVEVPSFYAVMKTWTVKRSLPIIKAPSA